jgi:hypothetical protein
MAMTDSGFTDTDHAAAEELGMKVEELGRIMDVWSKHAARLSRERRARSKAAEQAQVEDVSLEMLDWIACECEEEAP